MKRGYAELVERLRRYGIDHHADPIHARAADAIEALLAPGGGELAFQPTKRVDVMLVGGGRLAAVADVVVDLGEHGQHTASIWTHAWAVDALRDRLLGPLNERTEVAS